MEVKFKLGYGFYLLFSLLGFYGIVVYDLEWFFSYF